jgi:ribosomal protein S18 acetylase RimI-like enzyme
MGDVVVRRMDGPPEPGFDCGRTEQTTFLYERAHADQLAKLSVTYLYYVKGILAAYATICMDALPLGPRERDRTVRYREASACKLAQLGVALPFQGMGLGRHVVSDVIGLAQDETERVGCRFVTLDAQPDLVGWYEAMGFRRNRLRQEQRIRDALAHGRAPSSIPVSMRFDLREA